MSTYRRERKAIPVFRMEKWRKRGIKDCQFDSGQFDFLMVKLECIKLWDCVLTQFPMCLGGHSMKRRALSFIIALALCLDLLPGWALVNDAETYDGLCPHHPAHTDACGYASPVAEQECTHRHNDDCYTEVTDCIHAHTAECYPAPDDVSGADEPVLCTHVCTQDSGCVTKTLTCPHRHDDACGYAAGSPGAPCTFVCPICPIEDLIDRLPGSVSDQNIDQVQAQLSEIYALYDELTGDEQQQVDLSPCAALLDQMYGMETAALNDTSSPGYNLDEDLELTSPYVINVSATIVTNGHALTANKSSAIQVTGTGALEIVGGKVQANMGAGVEIQSGGSLTIREPGTTIIASTYALDIASGAQVHLFAGTYSGKLGAIRMADGDYSALLEPGYIFVDSTGNPISPENLTLAQQLTVGQCLDHPSKTYTHNAGTTTHTWTCSDCKLTGTEPCTFDFAQDGTGTCACGNGLSVVVNEDDLADLVYDGTLKPEQVGVTVTLTDGSSKELVKGTDYTVDIKSITNAGQATVTVTGITFNGTFVRTYIVAKDNPGLSWDTAAKPVPVAIDYDGAPVEAGDLPPVKINIQSTVDDLRQYLQYSYKKQSDTGYTGGLPTDAGTYDVIVSLPELPNFKGATSEAIILTVRPINPIVTAPEATVPTYNRAVQELVTAGALNPVAMADGLTIEFAESPSGPWSTDIPTGTDAGNYTVWYEVTGLTDNYIAPNPNPAQVTGVEIQRKAITPVVTLSQYTYLYDGGYKEPAVTVKDGDRVTDLSDTEYKVEYVNNRNVSTDANPAKVVVTDKIENGGNYDITQVEVEFKITLRTQDTLSITNKPSTFTYGDKFTLGTSGGSGNGLVTWEIILVAPDVNVAAVDPNSGQVTITGHGSVTVKATKSGKDPATNEVNYEDATAVWTFTADKKPVTATVTAKDKDYDGNTTAAVHAVVEQGVLAGDEITITGLTGAFDDENAGVDKSVTVVTTGAAITGHNSEHYDVSYSGATVKATIRKAVAKITTAPTAATLTYDGTAQALIATGAVVDPNSVLVEYALSETGPYSTDFPKGTNAGTYTVWYRVQETGNYTGLAPASVNVTIAKKQVSPTIELSGEGLQTDSTTTPPTYSYVYDGTPKEPVVTLKETDGTTVIPAGEYTVAYSGNVNVGTATVTVTAKADGNYTFDNAPVTANFTIGKEPAKVLAAPEAAGRPLTFNNFAQQLVTAGTAFGGTMVYRVGDTGDFESGIPEETNAGTYKVYYKVQGDSNHSDSAEAWLTVTIAPKVVNNPTIELLDGTNPLVSYTYDGTAKEPNVVVKDGSTVITNTEEYNVVFSDNTDAGTARVSITDKPNGNYTVTGSVTFVINKAGIVFNPAPSAATLTYNGTAQELLIPGTTSGGTVYYALGSATSEYHDYIPTGVNAGDYKVYYKVTGDRNHKDFPITEVPVTIQRKPLTAPTIELTPDSFEYDGNVHLPTVTVKDGDTVLPASEYTWTCDNNAPIQGGTYTITVSDKTGGNYDLIGANPNTATFTIGKAEQAELVIEGKPEQVYYGDRFTLSTSGGAGTGAVTLNVVGGNAVIDTDGNVTIKGVGEVTINAVKAGDTNYEHTSAQWTFTAAPKPVTASVTVSNKPYDGTTAATVASADITADLLAGDTVTIVPASITAAFDTPHAGTGKTVTLDASKVQVTGDDAAKYAISYPDTATADITKATTTINTAPAAIASLTYNGQPQALVTAGQTNVGFLVYSLDGTNFSPEIPTGTNAGTYSVYYKVDGTADYTGVAVNTTPISVTVAPKSITPKIELSETSFLYDGTKKNPTVTVMDGDTVINENQYTVTWAGTKSQTDADMLRVADTYTATIKNVSTGNNYTFNVTAAVEITPAEQAALHITGQPEHVYYGDTIITLGTTGGTGEGTVKWSVTTGSATIEESTGKLTITGTGAVTVRAERSVPNYGVVGDNWNFTVEPKPVVAAVTIAPKDYDGTTSVADTAIKAEVKAGDLVNAGDNFTISGLKGAYEDANAGTGKVITLDASHATATADTAKYTVIYPTSATGAINPKNVTVTVELSGNDLQTETKDGATTYYYKYDGTEKKPTVTVKANDNNAVLAASDYNVSYTNNKNVGDATVTVTAKTGGNYTVADAKVTFAIRKAGAVLISSPQAKDLTYNGTEQELVTVGAATGGTVVFSESLNGTYSEKIPKKEEAGTYTVYYMVKGDANHEDTAPGQTSATIKPKEITPAITLNPTSYVYDGNAHEPTVTVKDGNTEISGPNDDKPEYSVSYRDNVNAGTATVTVSDANGGNYIVNGMASFEITKAAPTVTAPTGKPGLQYNGELQDLVKAGVTNHGTVVYSVNGGNYSSAIPAASAVGTYTVNWKVQGDDNHSDTDPATLSVEIAKNKVTDPTISLSQNQFTYNGNQQKPTITVYDNNSRIIPEYEYTATITGAKSNNMVNVDTYTITIAASANSNYEFQGTLTRTFEIVPADQEAISITGNPAQVHYGDTIQLGVTGGTGSGTVKWKITGNTGTTLTQNGLLTVKDVNTPITVTVTRSKGGNYGEVSATWEFTAGKKPVTAVLTGVDKPFDGNASATVKAKVDASDLVFGDTFSIPDLTGTFDNKNVGTNKTITITGSAPTISDQKAANYEIAYPATATASILAVPATVGTIPGDVTPSLTYDASQAQALVTAGTATGGIMVYSLDGVNFTPAIPKAKDAGTYTVWYKAQGDGNHTDSTVGTKDVTIDKQTVATADLQIELSPPSAQYDGSVHQPAVTVRDGANNVIPESEYKVTYVTDGGKNWKDQGTYTVKVENITGGNYEVNIATADFTISTTAQAPLEIVNRPGLVYYGDTFTLSAVGGSGSSAVTWSSSDENIAHVDANGLVTIKGTGSATITAKKPGGTNYGDAEATYPLNALQKPITAIVTADDKEYNGNTDATIHVTWKDGDLINDDVIQFNPAPTGAFDSNAVGTNKQVTVTASLVNDATAQKYDITIPATTTASILKAVAAAPSVTAVENLEYTGSAQALVTGGDANTLYSGTKDGVYSATVPTGTNAGTYTVWYKEQGDANHSDSAPQAIELTISPKMLTLTDADVTVELSGNDLQKADDGTYYYAYDGTEKEPTVTIKDGSAVIPASEYTVTYSDNKNVTTADKKATVTITDNEGGNYTVSGSTTFEIRAGSAQLTSSPKANDLTYTGQPQELVTVGTATGGWIEYKLDGGTGDFSKKIPEGTNAGTYKVNYKVVGDDNHTDGPTGSVTVTIQPKTVVSPKVTVTGTYTYNGNEQKPTGTAVTVEDGDATIDAGEYTLSYRDNVNAGTATVIVTDNNGGNYTVNGTGTFQIGKAAATVGTAPTGKTGLHYNGGAQELLATPGTATSGTMVYSLSETGEYSAAIPTGKAVDEYEIWYKVLGDDNHSDSTATALSPKVKIDKNTVTNPTIQVKPPSVKYTGEKQEPTVTVRDDDGLLIDGSEYKVTYEDTTNNNADLTAVGTYTVTIAEVADGNYTFDTTDGKNTAEFKITQADQTPLTITGTRERVYCGDIILLGTTGGSSGGTMTWDVGGSTIASIDANGLLKITGTGSVTVTATSTKTGYTDQTATWNLYADKKPVTALVTAASKTYDGNADAAVTATLQTSDFVGTDSFTITLTGCTFEDPNAGTDKKVNVVSTNPTFTVNAGGTDNHENYAITYPATATASISKTDIENTDVTAPTAATGLTYTGLPQTLVETAGTATGGTMEYSTDGETYSTRFPTGTDAGSYDVWYRVKGDGNHNDTAGKKLDTQVTIAKQTVGAPTIEFNPSGATYDSQEHKPEVIVKDSNGRVIPAAEYTVGYGSTNWKDVGDHTVTITGKTDGNYSITGTPTKIFTILPAGQSPLSIVGQPGGKVQYGDVFTLSVNGGSGTGAVTWETSDSTVAFVNSQTGRVEIKKAGGPVTITARKAAGGGYGETTATWTFSAEKRPATAIVTARNKPYDGDTTATLDFSWKDGDLLGNDSITLSLTGAFDDANVGEDKIVRITRNGDLPDGGGKYAVTYNNTTTASITATQATVSGVQSGPWTYNGSEISLLQGGAATNGTIVYSRNGVDFMETSPTETNAGKYTVYYKARGNTNYADSEVRMVEVTIQPKTVTGPTIELSSDSVTYDGTEKEPEVVSVKDGSNVIPASEYTVSYRNNISVGTATVTITDVAGGNYTVSGSRNFTITAGAPAVTVEPEARNLTYNGREQTLVTRGTAVNGHMEYSFDEYDDYSTALPKGTDADVYEVWYKAVNDDGTETIPESVIAEIQPKSVTPVLTLSSNSLTYTGSALTPTVTVSASGQTLNPSTYQVSYSNNTEPGTATVTVTSIGGNYQFTAQTTFTIAKAKAAFLIEPEGKTGLVYTGQPQELIEENTGISLDGIVLYSTDAVNFSAAVPTATKVSSRHLVIAKVQGNATHADSDPVVLYVEIAKNNKGATVALESESTNFPYTGSAQRPPVIVLDSEGNVIDSGEYTVSYSDNINVGTATVTVSSKSSGNYSFTASTTFTIVDASQTPLTITGKKDTVYYGDTLTLGTTGGGSGTVTWSSSDTTIADIDTNGTIQKIGTSGSVTITATKGGSTDTWTFYAQPKPVTATVYAADKVYDGNNTATLTVALSGLVSGDNIATNTEDGVKATGQFTDANVGTRTVIITLTVPDAVSEKYDIGCNTTTTASITPKPASVTGSVTGKNLTYNSTEQALIEVSGVTVEGGNLAYSLDGNSYTFSIPTAADVGTYPIWYKVVASGENYKDSAPVKVTQDAVISADPNTPKVQCNPSSFPYDGTEKTPTVVVLDSTGQHIIPESEYTVEFPTPRTAVGTYTVTVTDKPGSNYNFTNPVTTTFEIMASSQAPLSITDKPANVYYGDTFYLSALGGTGNGAIKWSIAESGVAAINDSGAVTVSGTGSFTVEAYREASDGYSKSNTDSVTFVAQPKPVTPVVTASDKPYDGKTDATLTASWKSGDLMNGDNITLTVSGAFDTADAGTGKRVNLTGHTVEGTDAVKYTVNWPDYVTATINRVDAKIAGAPTGKTLTYTGSAQELVSAGTTENGIGTVVYSMDQYGAYSTTIPTATAAGAYRVWYKVADSVNYTGVAPAFVDVVIAEAPSSSDSYIPDAGAGTSFSMREPERTNTGLSAADGDALVQEAIESQSETIVIQPEVASDATEAVLSIPVETVSRISSETNAALTVSTPIANVTIPNAGLETLRAQEGDVGVAVTRQEDGAVMLTLVSADGETVESIPGGVTLTVPAENAGPGTVAVLVNDDGTREIIQRSVAEDGRMTIPLNGSATVEIVDNSKSFDDVPSDSWASEAITFASARELFGGTSETTFSPDQTMSRGMVATVLYRLEGQPDQAAASAYSDVGDDDWYADGVAWAAENGIVNGYGDGQFGPNDSVTREQFIVMLWRYVGSPEVNDHDLSFTDAAQVNSYALEAMCWAIENGVLSGNDSGQLVPGGTATRAEAAQMLKNFLENT